MIADIQAGKINCVIVKDISRFGRHYIQTMEYKAGTYLPPSVPFGYQKRCVGHDTALKINVAEALIVKGIFQSCIDGETIYSIVKKLNEENVC